MTKKEAIKCKQALAREISNIRKDYVGVAKEDLPEDIIMEVSSLMSEMKELRKFLGNE